MNQLEDEIEELTLQLNKEKSLNEKLHHAMHANMETCYKEGISLGLLIACPDLSDEQVINIRNHSWETYLKELKCQQH